MKPCICFLSGLSLLLGSGCAGPAIASEQPPIPVMAAPQTTAPTALEELVAPIALYPDALVALILPAATQSSDVVLAARFLSGSGNKTEIEQQPWDESVKGLAHYPDVVKWMDKNLSWTQRIGEAYVGEPDQVMAAIQQARWRAQQKGLLVSTAQQQVIVESGIIRIVPAQPDVIYVPRYDARVIYVERPTYYYPDTTWLTFGIGFGVGSWLSYDCDWRSRTIWIDHHRWENRHQYDWRHPHFPGRPEYVGREGGWHQWHPLPGRPRPTYRQFDRPGGHDYARPTPPSGAPHSNRDFDRDHDRDGRREHRDDQPARNRDRSPGGARPARIAEPRVDPLPAATPAAIDTNPSPSVRRWRGRDVTNSANPANGSGNLSGDNAEHRRPHLPSGAPPVADGNTATASPARPPRDRNVSDGAQRMGETRSFHRADRVAAPAEANAQPQIEAPAATRVEAVAPREHSAPRVQPSGNSSNGNDDRGGQRQETGRYRRGGEPDR